MKIEIKLQNKKYCDYPEKCPFLGSIEHCPNYCAFYKRMVISVEVRNKWLSYRREECIEENGL